MDPIRMQKQIKDNAEDLNTYLRDLKNWEADIKMKDAELRGIDRVEEPYPEIRSKAAKPKMYDDNKLMEAKNRPKNPRISAFDYASWDKLDIDKVCDEIDSNEAQKMRETAIYEKEMGNSHVKAGNWEKAIKCYSKAIKAYPNDAIFFANRALCYLKIKDFQKAECDCTKAIVLDAEYVKAWQRRSAAREGLGNIELAKRDLLKVLSLEPHNVESRSKLAALDKCPKEVSEEMCCDRLMEVAGGVEEKPYASEECPASNREASKGAEDQHSSDGQLILPWKGNKGGPIQPIYKPPHLRSKKSLRRVPIVEEFGNELEPGGGDGDVASANRSQPDEGIEFVQQNIPPLVQCGGSTEIPEPAPSELPSAPKSSVQFLLAWKTIKMYPELAIKYLQQISPESLPLIFGDSLDVSTLEEILNIMGQITWRVIPTVDTHLPKNYSTIEFLRSLSCVPRFSTLAMFLNPDEKMITRQLLAFCVKIGECSSEEAANLALKFML